MTNEFMNISAKDGSGGRKPEINYYSITLEDFMESNNRYVINSTLSRKYVWNDEKASLFIESILLGFPVPSVITYYNDSKEYVIDGYQRLVSIRNFFNNCYKLNKMSVLHYLNGLSYYELPDSIKICLKQYRLGITSVKAIENKYVFDIYSRINKRPYEGSNIDYLGNEDLKAIIDEMTNYKPFQNIFKSISKEEQAEFILRFLALYDDFDSYNGNMKDFIKSYISKTKNCITSEKRKELILTFKNTLDSCIRIFENDVFKNCICLQTSKGIKNVMYKSLSKPVFELQMLGVAQFSFSQIYRHSSIIKQKYEEALLHDDNFKPYYKKMSKRALEYRIDIWREIIREIV